MPYRAVFRCVAGCHGEYSLESAIYRCPTCGDLLEVVHDVKALQDRGPAAWIRLFDERYKRTTWPYGSSVWGKKEWVCPQIEDENVALSSSTCAKPACVNPNFLRASMAGP